VASAVRGIPEQVLEGSVGFLVPAGDVARRFELGRMVGEYLTFYEAMLNDK
jgi:hypothetical protein